MQGYNELIRRIKPEAVICYGEPFEEMQGTIIAVDYEKTNNLKQFREKSDVYVKSIYGYIYNEKGMGAAGNINSSISSIKSIDKNDLSENVRSSYNKYEEHNWKGTYEGQTPGTKAGSKWNNIPPELPVFDDYGNNITYREFDVNNKSEYSLRDAERFIRGSNGKVYYSPDHYETFYEIK